MTVSPLRVYMCIIPKVRDTLQFQETLICLSVLDGFQEPLREFHVCGRWVAYVSISL